MIIILVLLFCFVICCSVSSGVAFFIYSNNITKTSATKTTSKGIKARYVKIIRSDNQDKPIHVSEIEVYDKSNNKVTTEITPSLSPQYGETTQFGPQFLIDGQAPTTYPSGYTLPHTTASKDAFMQLDLNQDKEISKVIIKNRLDMNKELLVGCSLLLLNSSNTEVYRKAITATQDVYEFVA